MKRPEAAARLDLQRRRKPQCSNIPQVPFGRSMLERCFSHYRITGKLGQGGMGVVYIAEDTLLHREVAIKFATAGGDGQDSAQQLLREARAASSLIHPNIAAVYDCGEYEGSPYIVMELVRGHSLARELESGPLEPSRAVTIVTRVAEALAEAHRRGVTHRDIKPSNVLLGERGEVKVVDFGLARRTAPLAAAAAAGSLPTATIEDTISGTPAYMSPEQVRGGAADARSDVFSLGAVLYECLTGRRAFEAATAIETLAKVLGHDPPAPSSVSPAVPPALDAVVAKALAKDAAARYTSATEILDDLRATVAGTRPAAAPARRGRPGSARGLRRWGVVGAAAVLVAVMLFFFWLWPGRTYNPSPEARRWYEEGVNALSDGTYHKAAQALEQAVRLDGGYTLAQARLAEAWNELDYSDRARRAMLAALPPGEALPGVSRSELLHIQAIHRVLTRDYRDAAAKYRELANRAEEDGKRRILLDLGRVYEKSENPKAALGVYLDAVRRYPQYPAAHLRAGTVYRRLGEPNKAEESLRKAESLYRALSNVEGITEALYQRSILANNGGRFADARALLEQALQMAQAGGNEHQRITALLQLNSVCYRQGLIDEARRHAVAALDLARRHGFHDLTARSLLELGTDDQLQGDAEAAKQRFAEALAAAQQFNGLRTEARARFSLASVRVDLGETDEALEDIGRALEFYRSAGYRYEASRCAMLEARANRIKGEYEQARAAARAELEAARAAGDPEQARLALELNGAVLEDEERYTEALAYYQQARDDSRAQGDQVGERYAAQACGGALWRLGRYAEARRELAEAAALAERAKDQALAASIELSRAEMALSEGRLAQATAAARKALLLATEDRVILATATRVTAAAAAESGQARESVRMAEEALAAARATGNARTVLSALLTRAEVLLASEDVARAAETARAARDAASRRGQIESSWRACVAAAMAAERVSDTDTRRRSAADAAALMAEIGRSMSPEDFRTYSARPDIRRLAQRMSNLARR